VVLFTRGVCDELLSFVVFSRSTYTAATGHFTRTKKSFAQCRQNLILLGSVFVAMLETPPETFRCPACGDDPAYIVIDGQSLGFKRRPDTNVVRPALLVPPLPIDVELLCVLPTATLRRAVRKILRCSEEINQVEKGLLRKWLHSTSAPKARKGRRPKPNADVYVAAARLFSEFFPPDGVRPATGEEQDSSHNTDEASDDSMSDASVRAAGTDALPATHPSTINDTTDGDTAAVREPVASAAKPWSKRTGMCAPALSKIPANRHMQWSAARTFLLAMFGDPVVGLFGAVKDDPLPPDPNTASNMDHNEDSILLRDPNPVTRLAGALMLDDPTRWHHYAAAADAVGFVANFLGRFGKHLDANKVLRNATGSLLHFAVRLEAIVDSKFKEVANRAAQQDTGVNKDYCEEWGGTPTAADFKRFAATHPAFKGKDLDSVYSCFEYFGCLPRVRPAIFAHKARRKAKRRRGAAAGRAAPRHKRGNQAELEDDNDRCNKAFPTHKDLTAGVFNVVCPHVITLGFRVMFDPESVSDALSVILERFPKLPEVIFYDVGCKLDRNALRRVRNIFRGHGVKVVLDRVHAKGHTCSPIFFPDESLGKTNGVATQAAEVQHSISVKFRTHLAYMSPESFMSHRVVQLALMNLSAAYKLAHPGAKKENDDADITTFFHSSLNKSCARSVHCCCPATRQLALV